LLKVRNKGVRQACIEWIKYEETDGFRVLVEQGLGDLIVEALVVKYARSFPETAVKLAA